MRVQKDLACHTLEKNVRTIDKPFYLIHTYEVGLNEKAFIRYGRIFMKKETTLHIIVSGLLLTLGILLPIIFHSINLLGNVFLPMHITVFIGGFFLPPSIAVMLGVMTPLISGVITGMPPLFPMAIIMAFELGAYSFIITRTRNNLSVVKSLIVAMVGGRIVAGLIVFVMATVFGVDLSPLLFVKTAIVTGLPGIVLHLILIPIVVIAIKTTFGPVE